MANPADHDRALRSARLRALITATYPDSTAKEVAAACGVEASLLSKCTSGTRGRDTNGNPTPTLQQICTHLLPDHPNAAQWVITGDDTHRPPYSVVPADTANAAYIDAAEKAARAAVENAHDFHGPRYHADKRTAQHHSDTQAFKEHEQTRSNATHMARLLASAFPQAAELVTLQNTANDLSLPYTQRRQAQQDVANALLDLGDDVAAFAIMNEQAQRLQEIQELTD